MPHFAAPSIRPVDSMACIQSMRANHQTTARLHAHIGLRAVHNIRSAPRRRRCDALNLIRSSAKKRTTVADPPAVADNIEREFLPEVIVFDLDNTVWTPELYQLRKAPKAWKNIRLFDGAAAALTELSTADAWRGCQVAAASRANAVTWAHNLLKEFTVGGGAGEESTTLAELLTVAEVYPGSKKKHFGQIRKRTGVPYERMLFFDDYIGNCQDVAELGVMSVKVGSGLNRETWALAVRVFAGRCAAGAFMGSTFSEKGLRLEWDSMREEAISPLNGDRRPKPDGTPASRPPPTTVPTALPSIARVAGSVKWYSVEKGYGFVEVDGGGADVYLSHANLRAAMIDGAAVTQGLRLTFVKEAGPGGRGERATEIEFEGGIGEVVVHGGTGEAAVRVPCFSMRQPFAALLLNGAKTLESRGNDMLAAFEGQRVALHVGAKRWAGPEAYVQLLKRRGLSEREIDALCQLPSGAKRGAVVALLTLGRTYEPTDKQRSEEGEVWQGVLATEQGIGRYVTEVKKVALLREAVRMPGQPGVWHCSLPERVLP